MKFHIYAFLILFLCAFFFAPSADAATIGKPMQSLGLVGYWSFDVGKGGAKAVDMSGSGNNGTLTNMNTTAAWVGGKIGNALSFDGSNDLIVLGSPAALDNIGGSPGSKTITAWIYQTGWGEGNLGTIWQKGSDAFGSGWNFQLKNDAAPLATFRGTIGGATPGVATAVANTISLNNWQFVAITYIGADGGPRLWIGGEEVSYDSRNDVTTYASDASSNACVGNRCGADRTFKGSIDEVRIYNRALSADEIKRLYRQTSPQVNASQANKLRQGLVGMWTFDGVDMGTTSAIDRSGNANTGWLINGTKKSIGKIGQALNFDGVDDYVDVASNSILNAYPITISVWAKINPVQAGTYPALVNKYVNGSLNGWQIYTEVSSKKLCAWYFRSSGNSTGYEGVNCFGSVTGYFDNQWHLVTFVVDASGSVLYVDGVSKRTSAWTGTAGATNTTQNISIGTYPNAQGYLNGLIDEVRVYNRALTPTEIRQLYKAGSSFHPNTTNKSTIRDGLVGHWTFDGADMGTTSARDASGNANTGWLINGAKKAIGRIGQALNFDGVDDNVSAVIGSVPSATFTISAWIKLNELGREQHAAEFTGTQFYVASNNKLGTGNWGNAAGSTALTKGQWYHIVITRNSSQLLLFLNGSQDGSGSVLTNEPSSPFVIGRFYGAGNYWFNGLLDEVRVYNRALTQAEIKRLYNMGR